YEQNQQKNKNKHNQRLEPAFLHQLSSQLSCVSSLKSILTAPDFNRKVFLYFYLSDIRVNMENRIQAKSMIECLLKIVVEKGEDVMSHWKNVYEKWRSFEQLDPDLKQELDMMADDQKKLEDAFYTELTFGTGGMRGELGPGINRTNIYTVRKVVNGLANYLTDQSGDVRDRGVAVAYDSRYMSQEFAIETAKVLGAHGIKAYVFDTLHPTPLLSFAVRYLGAAAGAMITASHNPPEYNGFKVYNEDGGQITPEEASDIIGYIQETEDELTVPYLEKCELEEQELLNWIGREIDNAYLEKL